jgi:hypothetical protein
MAYHGSGAMANDKRVNIALQTSDEQWRGKNAVRAGKSCGEKPFYI